MAYYSIFGLNGFGVYDNYAKVQEARTYLIHSNCKKHKSFQEAKNDAIEQFNDLQDSDVKIVLNPDEISLSLNFTKYRKQLLKERGMM